MVTARPLIGKWVDRHRKLINLTDRSSILLVVYTAFSAAVVEGIWHRIDGWSLLTIPVMSLVLLTVVLVINTYAARWLGFNTADEITIVFCGSKKSGERHPDGQRAVPGRGGGRHGAAADDFPPVQLMVCAVLAQRYARKTAKQRAEAEALLAK